MPAAAIAWRNPRLVITVTTTVSSASSPRSVPVDREMAMTWSPSTTLPSASTAIS